MKVLLFLLTLNCFTAFSQIRWVDSNFEWQQAAYSSGQLSIAYFTADWCGPCKNMRKTVWNQPSVIALSRNYLPVKYNMTHQGASTKPFTNIPGYPTIYISDYLGNQYYEFGPVYLEDAIKIFESFPKDVSLLYRALSKTEEEGASASDFLNVSQVYLHYASKLEDGIGRTAFVSKAKTYLAKSQKKANSADATFQEEIELTEVLYQICDGKTAKNVKVLTEKYATVSDKNSSFKVYIMAVAHLLLNKQDAVDKYVADLKKTDESSVYLQRLLIKDKAPAVEKDNYTVSGHIDGLSSTVDCYFTYKNEFNEYQRVDFVIKEGDFSFSGRVYESCVVKVVVNDSSVIKKLGNEIVSANCYNIVFVAVPDQTITIKGDVNGFMNAYPSGDYENEMLASLTSKLNPVVSKTIELAISAEKSGNLSEEESKNLTNIMNQLTERTHSISGQFITEHISSVAGLWLLRDLMNQSLVNKNVLLNLITKVEGKYYNHPYYQDVLSKLGSMK